MGALSLCEAFPLMTKRESAEVEGCWHLFMEVTFLYIVQIRTKQFLIVLLVPERSTESLWVNIFKINATKIDYGYQTGRNESTFFECQRFGKPNQKS